MAGMVFRDPAEWARQWGWISPRKARNDAAALRRLATIIRDSLGHEDEGAQWWAKECERIAKRLEGSR